MKKNLLGYTLPKLTEEFLGLNQSKFRAKQVFGWIYGKKVFDFEAMTDVSKDFRAVLKDAYCVSLPTIYTKQEGSDGTIKVLLEMEDGAKVESVLMPYNYGDAICVSSQVGCNMGCAFCASGLLRKERNLTTAEMVGEVLVMNSLLAPLGRHVTHIDVMGTGEPFDNYDNVIRFLRLVSSEDSLNIGMRHITVSTCGIVPRIYDFADLQLQTGLSISLHAPDDESRSRTMPVNRRYPIAEVMKSARYYVDKTHRRITFEYALIDGENDSDATAYKLATLLKGLLCHVNLIPVNNVTGAGYKKSSLKRQQAFADILSKAGVNATVRRTLGSDIDASCGQLKRNFTKGDV